MSLQNTCPAITITKLKSKSKSKSAVLHARLISFPLPDTESDGGISTPWIAVASKTHSSLDSDTPEIQDLADSLISAYTEDLVFVTTPILLCVSPLQESGDYASDEHISMPSGTSELLPQPITADRLIASLSKWIPRWRRWQEKAFAHSANISIDPSITACGPVTRSDIYAHKKGPLEEKARHPPEDPRPWANPSSLPAAVDEPGAPPSSDTCAILIAEDNKVCCLVLAKLLFKLGLNFKVAQNGQEAIDEYKRDPKRYWCVFMDLGMPVVDGDTASRWIRGFERATGLEPCVMVSMHSGRRETGLKTDVFDYFLDKPIRRSGIESILRAEKEKELRLVQPC
ncbi:response regulator receiver domain protein [Metarhizium robertsii]|uniref:Signal transduction response regulator, receiver domain protein n=2 Tax=Metarhizium robertsii TaxID=568076 RepID=E9EV97_METRA|nr:Signal transduction response regulator, receiver domain protein [Metarhizium robertsii ARSEF 23]EFZ00169.1 Signal transduction response regulator, receiver domain protein [Metarhizium robertsii ARSEF 23]EXV02623.1 response regulator receiver domain protein [Metarhizium robertsii]